MNVLEGQDILADDFIREDAINRESTVPTDIQKFFDGATIFITGGTGFLGRVLLEKLLRSCGNIKRIYLLIRPKKGKSEDERLKTLFDEPLFEIIKRKRSNFLQVITLLPGDLNCPDGIVSKEDRQLLVETVDVVFHCGATVRFDEKIRTAVAINLRATKEILNMAHEMKNLKALIHISTAYSNCPLREIDEVFYPPPYNYQKITTIVDSFDDKLLDTITPLLLDEWPNTYTFTKTIGEDMIREYGKGLPVAIVRPSIVISTYREPISGYINNYYGPQGVVFGAAQGLLRTLHCDPDVIADMVPVDMLINAVIALAWDIAQTKGDNPNFEKVSWKEDNFDDNSNVKKPEASDEIPIINYVSSKTNPITWGRFMHYNYEAGKLTASRLQIWHSALTLNKNKTINFMYQVACHYFPAAVYDGVQIIKGKKPQLLAGYRKIDKFTQLISYFSTSQWKFKHDNLTKLWSKLSPRDREIFNFALEELDWKIYFTRYLKGLQVYVVKEDMVPHAEGRRRALQLKVLHYITVTAFNLLLFLFLWWIYSLLFG